MKSNIIVLLLLIACAGNPLVCLARREVTTHKINLDISPQERYNKLIPHFNETVWGFYNKYFANDKILTGILYGLVDARGQENAEQQGEIEGLATQSGLPLKFVRGVQFLYELSTLMVPITNLTRIATNTVVSGNQEYGIDYVPKEYAPLKKILPWRAGCTGIIAKCADGKVYHARNLDFAPYQVMNELVFNAIFIKGGKEVFRTQMVAGYTMPLTAMKMGKNGYTIEVNTRFTDHWGGNKEMLENLKSGRVLSGWTLRKILETKTDYESAVFAMSTLPFVAQEFLIVSGVKKGTILARNPDSMAHRQVLGKHNMDERNDYIIMTNFDFYFHDIREWFDPTAGGGFGRPSRRKAAQKVLNATSVLTPEILFQAINTKYVIADTIFQAIMNVETGFWNTSQPDSRKKGMLAVQAATNHQQLE
jgi:hypothetical protein